ncbi:MAG: 50S ribosomal protein L35 [Parcubacteria group bacterium]|nr:50S ribosomal protein L35 [Parcubacteria group bacterium]
MKTNKSYTKRLKVTKNGKVLARVPGQNHFNAKAPRKNQLKKRRIVGFKISPKNKSRFMPHS